MIKPLILTFAIFITSLCLLPIPTFAAQDPRMAQLSVENRRTVLQADGTQEITLVFTYSGSAGDDLSGIEIVLEDPRTGVACYWPALSTNPADVASNPTREIVVTKNCDYRSSGSGTIVLDLRLKLDGSWFWPNDCSGFAQTRCSLIRGLVRIENIVGAQNDQYIANVVPLGSNSFRVDMGGDNGGTGGFTSEDRITRTFPCYDTFWGIYTCKYRIRVKGYTGTDFNAWPTSPINYSCSGAGIDPTEANYTLGGNVVPSGFVCDFSNFTGSSITVALYRGTDGAISEVGTTAISEYVVNLASSRGYLVDAVLNSVTSAPNDFTVRVQLLPGSGIRDYFAKVTNRSGGGIVPSRECKFASRGIHEIVTTDCDFSNINPRGSYNLTLYDGAGVILNSIPLPLVQVNPASSGGICGCYDDSAGVNACTFTPATFCWAGFEPRISACGFTCTCSCVYVPGAVGPGGIPLPPLDFGLADFQRWTEKGQQYIIAFGIFASIFIVPYFGVLLASGNPESIKEGLEWAKSWAFGLLLLLLSSFVIRIIGSDILGF